MLNILKWYCIVFNPLLLVIALVDLSFRILTGKFWIANPTILIVAIFLGTFGYFSSLSGAIGSTQP